MDLCEQCGFDFDAIGAGEIAPRVTTGVADLVAELTKEIAASGNPGRSAPALAAGRWSTLEYAAHVRDVLLTIRDRTVIGLVEDYPDFKSMYRDERIELGLYAPDTHDAVSGELRASANMLVRLLAAIEPDQLERVVQYGQPNSSDRTLLWMAKQAVHEIEHHLSDTRKNAEFQPTITID